jgi:hypothetical protein
VSLSLALLSLIAPSAHATAIFTALVGINSPLQADAIAGGFDVLIGTIPGVSGANIVITGLGIGGDSDAGAGDNRFQIVDGASVDVQWVAGQQTTPATYRLDPTPVVAGPNANARGISFIDVNHVLAVGASAVIYWDYHFDYDGRYTFASDPLGNFYDDSPFPASIRALVRYEIVAVPEPGTMLLLAFAFLSILLYGVKSPSLKEARLGIRRDF